MKSVFMFELEQCVQLSHTAEKGTVIGRAQYSSSKDQYLVRYMAGDGRQVEAWWCETAIIPGE